MRTCTFRAGLLAGLSGLVLAACASGAESPAPDAPSGAALSAAKGDGATIVAGVEAGVQERLAAAPLDEEGVRRAISLGVEQGFEVVASPAIPAPGEPVTLLVLGQADAVTLRVTRSGWSAWKDLEAEPFEGGFAFVFASGVIDHELAIRVQAAGELWLNNGGANYALKATEPTVVQWVGGQLAEQGGVTRHGAVWAAHATRIAVETWPLVPGTDAVLHWTVDGYASVHDVPMHIVSLSGGANGHNAQWVGEIPAQAEGAELLWWVEAGAGAATVWDSLGGDNYHAEVIAPPQATWASAGRYQFTKCYDWTQGCQAGWFWYEGLEPVLSLSPGSYQAYAAAPYPALEVYVPGVTDATDTEGLREAVERGLLMAQIWSPLFAEGDGEGWGSRDLSLQARVGNNARLAWQGRHQGAPTLPPFQALCVASGDYPYVFRVSGDGGASWRWLGTGGALDAGGDDFLIAWDSGAPTWSPSFGAVPSVDGAWALSEGQLHVELVNTSDETYSIEGVGLDDPAGAFDVQVKSCKAADCGPVLAPGDRLKLGLTHSGEPGEATLSVQVSSDARCGVSTWSAALSAD